MTRMTRSYTTRPQTMRVPRGRRLRGTTAYCCRTAATLLVTLGHAFVADDARRDLVECEGKRLRLGDLRKLGRLRQQGLIADAVDHLVDLARAACRDDAEGVLRVDLREQQVDVRLNDHRFVLLRGIGRLRQARRSLGACRRFVPQ